MSIHMCVYLYLTLPAPLLRFFFPWGGQLRTWDMTPVFSASVLGFFSGLLGGGREGFLPSFFFSFPLFFSSWEGGKDGV